jgi:hypothetical protein
VHDGSSTRKRDCHGRSNTSRPPQAIETGTSIALPLWKRSRNVAEKIASKPDAFAKAFDASIAATGGNAHGRPKNCQSKIVRVMGLLVSYGSVDFNRRAIARYV